MTNPRLGLRVMETSVVPGSQVRRWALRAREVSER